METLTYHELYGEALHTYQLYLMCSGVLTNPSAKMSLLKWPDIVESSLNYIKAMEDENLEDSHREKLEADFYEVIGNPVVAIFYGAKERVKQIVGKEPVEVESALEDPIACKNDNLAKINKMFNTLEVITSLKYPTLEKYSGSNNS